jgi:hypothetical protein
MTVVVLDQHDTDRFPMFHCASVPAMRGRMVNGC